MVERKDQEPSKKDDKEKRQSFIDVLAAKFKELVEKIKELLRKKEQEGLNEEETKHLEDLKGEKRKRREEFFKTKYGKRVQARLRQARSKVNKGIDRELQDLQTASEDELNEKLKAVQEKIGEQRQIAQEKWEREDANIRDDKFKGIFEDDLTQLLREKEMKVLQSVLGKRKKGVEPRQAQKNQRTEEEKRKIAEAIAEIEREGEKRLLDDNPDVKSRGLNDLSKAQSVMRNYVEGAGERFSPYSLTLEEKAKLSTEKGRDEVFNIILAPFGLDKKKNFRENVDMTALGRRIDFMIQLKDMPGVLERYSLRLGFEEYTHNLDFFLSGHAHPDKLPDLLAYFQSNMMDVAVRGKGVVATFRAYEQAFDRLILLEGKLASKKMSYDAITGKNWVDNWAQEQAQKTLRAYCVEHDDLDYDRDFAPYESTFLRTGRKLFIFSLRGDEIQASTTAPRDLKEMGAPWHEDLWRRLDPLGLPLRYWGDKPKLKEFVGKNADVGLTNLYYFYTGKIIPSRFETKEDWENAVAEIQEKKEAQLNLFDIGGILSTSHWRSTGAMKHIPKELARFMGIEMEYKLLGADHDSKREALAHGRIRNPFRLFQLAGKEEQERILRNCRLKREDLESIYDDMAQALQRKVYDQQTKIQKLIYEYDERGNIVGRRIPAETEIDQFLQKEGKKGLDFGFSQNARQLENFVQAIQSHFQSPELDKDGHLVKGKKGNEFFEKLVEKRFPFSMGTDDAPLELFSFVELGDVALQRRFRDLGAEAQAAQAFWKLISDAGIHLQKNENIVEALKAIAEPIVAYGGPETDKAMLTLIDRTLHLVEEDKLQGILPWPLCELRDKWGLTSKAENMFGQRAMSLDKEEMRLLVEEMIGAGLFQEMTAKEARRQLFDKHKLWRRHVIGQKAWRYGFGVFGGVALSAVYVFVRQLQKDIEETAKEA